jgi:hypothetical protein
MKTTANSGKDVVSADRRAVWALLRTVRDLRLSVTAGRPMALPNSLRLCRRRLKPASRRDTAVLELLAATYRRHQPFRGGPHAIRVRNEM